MDLISYEDVREQTEGECRNLLLGNGFSIACDESMAYSSLHEWAVEHGHLSLQEDRVFARLRTHNFEYVMARLNEAAAICNEYGMDNGVLLNSVSEVQAALAAAICDLHLPSPYRMPSDRREACADFLMENDSIFSTNYDLLLYWVLNRQVCREVFADGFVDGLWNGEKPDRAFSTAHYRDINSWYLHGALHLYECNESAAKRVSREVDGGLLGQIRDAIDNSNFPLIVTEGTAQEKLARIQSNRYLQTALAALSTIEGPLIIYGSRLAECDQHILDAIVENPQIPALYISVRGDIGDSDNLELEIRMIHAQSRRRDLAHGASLDVYYYDSDTANVWG